MQPVPDVLKVLGEFLSVIDEVLSAIELYRLVDQQMRLIQNGAEVLDPVSLSVPQLFEGFLRAGQVHIRASRFADRTCETAYDRHPDQRLVQSQLPCNPPQLRGIRKLLLRQNIEKVLFPVSAQSDLFLLLLVAEHGLHREPCDQRDFVDPVRIAGHADDAFLASLMRDRHIDAGQNAGEFFFIADHDHILFSADDPVRHFVISADPRGIAAGDDHAALIHDIDIVFCVLSQTFYEFFCQFGLDHGARPCPAAFAASCSAALAASNPGSKNHIHDYIPREVCYEHKIVQKTPDFVYCIRGRSVLRLSGLSN